MLDARNPKSRPWLVARRELDQLIIVPRTTRGEARDISKGVAVPQLGECYPDPGHFLSADYQEFQPAKLEKMERDGTLLRRCDEMLPLAELAQVLGHEVWEEYFGARAQNGGLQ